MTWPDFKFPPINLYNVFAWTSKVQDTRKAVARKCVKEELEFMGLKIVKTKRL